MWTSDDIIRIELGKGVITAGNGQNNRSIIQRISGNKHEEGIPLILSKVKDIRQRLSAEGLILPAIKFTDNSTINDNEFICYWGIEIAHHSIKSLTELYCFIENKAREYGIIARGKARMFIGEAHNLIAIDNIQAAYQNYLLAYYNAHCNGEYFECSWALTEVASIMATSQYDFSVALSSAAVTHCEHPSIIDYRLKCQVYLNAASIEKISNPSKAIGLFEKCVNCSFVNKDKYYSLLALLGLAEIYSSLATTEGCQQAIDCYSKALNIVQADKDIAYAVQQKMIDLYKVQLDNIQNNNTRNVGNKHHELISVLVSTVCRSLGEAAVFRLFNVPTGCSLFSIGSRTNNIINDGKFGMVTFNNYNN